MPQYECAIVLSATLSDEQIQEHIEQVKTWIAGLGAQVSDVDIWGRKRLAYPIRRQHEGFYVIYYFALDQGQGQGRFDEFEKRLNTVEAVLRHLVVRLPVLKEPPRLPREEEEGEKGEPREPAEKKPSEEEEETELSQTAAPDSLAAAEPREPTVSVPQTAGEQEGSAAPEPQTPGEQEKSVTPTGPTPEE